MAIRTPRRCWLFSVARPLGGRGANRRLLDRRANRWAGGDVMDAGELQRVARLVDINRQRISRIEEQVTRLDEIIIEQDGVIRALKALPDDERRTMIPLGGGIQLPVTPTGDGAVVDIGSGVQAERPRNEVISILESRRSEVAEVLSQLREELREAEDAVKSLAEDFADGAKALQSTEETIQEATEQPDSTEPKPKRRRRRSGGELTLDD